MSEEMAKSDSASEESALNGAAASVASVAEGSEHAPESSDEPATKEIEESSTLKKEEEMEIDAPSIKIANVTVTVDRETESPTYSPVDPSIDEPQIKEEIEDKRGIKRRASEAFSEGVEEFKGFEIKEEETLTLDYIKVLDRLEAEVAAAIVDFTPLKSVMATPPVPLRASKRSRQDTDSSRPSSALSSRSESDATSTEVAASPGAAGRRRTTTEISSPLLRVPLERGWKRELVYRAALDSHSRRNADIYYYTPAGKKLRSTREVSEHLSGTGLTLENFSFFKEPLGLDDPEKEIIRDAKVMRKAESPIAASVPRAPARVATPETPKSPPGKLKVKSMGARLSTSTRASPVQKTGKKAPSTPTTTSDNNNSAAWKKTADSTPDADLAQTYQIAQTEQVAQTYQTALKDEKEPITQETVAMASEVVQDSDLKVSGTVIPRPEAPVTPPVKNVPPTPVIKESPGRAQQPCSMSCGGGRVPSLCCRSCLCLYHPVCVQHMTGTPFLCKNCRGDSAPEPAVHKPARAPAAGVPPPQQHNRVTLRMKVASSGGAEGERVWSVAPPTQTQHTQHTQHTHITTHTLPQSIAILNGRRFIVVPRAMATQPQ